MDVYMYNTWFGDCFRINDKHNNLFVDFGIHQGCLSGDKPIFINAYSCVDRVHRDDVHKKISDEIVAFSEKPNLLLTHYHLDHYSGLLYMKSSMPHHSPIFNKVYLPDIWGVPNSKNIIAILILEALMDNSKLGKKGCTLLELVHFLCKDVEKVYLLRRGELFEDKKFTALWPDVNLVGAVAKDLLPKEDMDWLQKIIFFAEGLTDIVMSLTEGQKDSASREENCKKVEKMIIEFDELYDEDKITNLFKQDEKIMLNEFGNDISIVFHNTTSNESNMLFTGDLSAKYLAMIDNNYDGMVPMHKNYCYIKIPHHATNGSGSSLHYHDFSMYNPKILMIPNGKCCTDSYKTCSKYGHDIVNIADKGTIKVYCSNSNWCEMNPTGKFCDCNCGANYTNIIFPNCSSIVT